MPHSNGEKDRLYTISLELDQAREEGDHQRIQHLLLTETPSIWYSLGPDRFVELLRYLVQYFGDAEPILARSISSLEQSPLNNMSTTSYNGRKAPDDALPHADFFPPLTGLVNARTRGNPWEALSYAETLNSFVQKLPPGVIVRTGWNIHAPLQIGVSAILAGDFTRALTAFTQVQIQSAASSYKSATRSALIKSAMIHGMFGNTATAHSRLERASTIPRTTSWMENIFDEQHKMAHLMTDMSPTEDTLVKLQSLDVESLYEMWPFYVVLTYRLLETSHRLDELEDFLAPVRGLLTSHKNGQGFSGSACYAIRALAAIRAGHLTEAQRFLDKTDDRVGFKYMLQATLYLYTSRAKDAIQIALRLHGSVKGFRALEIRRLAILAAAYEQNADPLNATEVLRNAVQQPGGLQPHEIGLFSPESRKLALQNVPDWPAAPDTASYFLLDLPKPLTPLTPRELEILQELGRDASRDEIALQLKISVNTLKSQLRSIYKKLHVSSRKEAVRQARSRRILQ